MDDSHFSDQPADLIGQEEHAVDGLGYFQSLTFPALTLVAAVEPHSPGTPRHPHKLAKGCTGSKITDR
jgi:hypothetical protein